MKTLERVRNNILALQTVCGYAVNTTGLIKQSIALNTQLDFLQPYATFADDLLVLNYANYQLKRNINSDTVKLYICNILLAEKYNLETITGTLDLDYNPIENYNMVEDGTDKRSLAYAQRVTNSQMESATKTSSGDTTHQVAPFDTTTLTTTEKDTVSNTQQPYTDKSQQTENARTDNDDLIHHLTRTGNIGVTTSQQMIESERALANINIPAMIVDIIIKNICKGVQATL